MKLTGKLNAGMANKVSNTVCSSCGTKTSIGMKYCGKCDANMMEES